VRKLTLLLILLLPVCVKAEYRSTEICVIGWGKGPGQLFMLPEEITDSGFLESAKGPDKAFIDRSENIIISSSQTFQLKGFSNTGKLLFDYSIDGAEYNLEMYDEAPGKIYIDSLFHIYLLSDTAIRYIPVVDYNGQIIDKIRPFEQDPGAHIHFMNWSPSRILLFFNWDYGWVRYIEGKSTPGGHSGFLANDGNYYTVYNKSSSSIEFTSYENPDSRGATDLKKVSEIILGFFGITVAEILNGGNGDYIYVYLGKENSNSKVIWKCDLEYKVSDILVLEDQNPFGGLKIMPFVRYDGNIYQFLFQEDGLHVVRWSKD